MKHIKYSIVLFLFLNSCSFFFPKDRKVKIHIKVSEISSSLMEDVEKVDCNWNKKEDKAVLSYSSGNELRYDLVCTPHPGGKKIDLRVYSDEKLVQKIDSVAFMAKMSSLEFGGESWLADLDQDGFLDLVQRTYSVNDMSKDFMRISYWSRDKKALLKEEVSDTDLKSYKATYKITQRK